MSPRHLFRLAVATLASCSVAALPVLPQTPPAAPAATAAPSPAAEEDPWPRRLVTAQETFLVYQPQIDSWKKNVLEGHAAVSVQTKGAKEPTFGVIWFKSRTDVDKVNRIVHLEDLDIVRSSFPSAPDKAAAWTAALHESDPARQSKAISLDRLTADLGINQAKAAGEKRPLDNTPPKIIVSTVPAVLVIVAGEPAYRPQKDTDLERLINTSAIVLKDAAGSLYFHLFDGWMEAASLEGPWKVADPREGVRHNLDQALKEILAAKNGDPMTGGSESDPKAPKPSLRKTPIPEVHMETTPADLIVVNGQPNYEPIPGTALLFVTNTTGRVFKDIDNQKAYVLIAGRWFSAPDTSGPWVYVPHGSLPPDFAKIPDDSPMENVKASVPGTRQAEAAMVAAGIPQTATVKRSTPIKPITFDGEPRFKPIADTTLEYVVNASTPIIKSGPDAFWACQGGVWFSSTAVKGPWIVAAWVPPAIYTIPPSSPLYSLTFVEVYGSTPSVVYVGYTPGYMGSIVYDGVVVYGTGYVYTPWVGTVWYGPPVTYGYGVNLAYTPYTGWAFAFGIGCGFAMGAAMCGYGWGYCGWGWGAAWGGWYGHYGAAAWGYGGGAVWGPGYSRWSSGNVYSQWGATSAVTRTGGGYNAWTGNAWRGTEGSFYNSTTGVGGTGARGGAYNAYTGNYAAGEAGTVASSRTGASATGYRGTYGNAYTGQSVTGSRGVVTGPGGQTTSVAGVHGDQGGAVRVGNDVYADHDGNIYKGGGAAGWSQWNSSSHSWGKVNDSTRTTSLDGWSQARSAGDDRVSNFRSSGWGGHTAGGGRPSWGGGGWGGFHGGGWGGGGLRGGGGFRR
jgi:hypothetical protein